MLQLQSKLPNQGVTIFSVMTELAQRLNALNLAQGFPDFPAPPALLEALCQATMDGHNQYSAGDGVLALREQMAQQFLQRDALQLDPISEISITSGATIAIFCAIQACVHTDDEVIIFDPSYDSYAPAVRLAGGTSIRINLPAPSFQVDWQKVKDSINSKTRMIIVNTPHNPTGAVWSQQDWQQLITLIQAHNIIVLSDEVYEHLVFDGQQHYSALQFPELRERSLVIGSFGKSHHVTGWKTGYCVAAAPLMQLFRQVYQFANFCGTTPCQIALASYMQQHPEHVQQLPQFYQAKRDVFNAQLVNSRFTFTPSQGTYFQSLDYSAIRPDLTDIEMCHWLAEQHKIVAIPLSAFYQQAPKSLKLLRFCFAKTDQTLHRAGEILSQC